MVARLWHVRTRLADADAYLALQRRRALPDYKTTPGNSGTWILQRAEGEVCPFYTLTC